MTGDKEYTEGESRYCARELLNNLENKPIDPCKADIFSLGATLYELCLGRELGGIILRSHFVRNVNKRNNNSE
jgi:hypothetical protein